MARIYVSSTYSDLVVYREAVYKALRGMRHDAIAMEDYRAEGQRPLHKCLEDVASCDLYIGIFAWRYGYIPSQDHTESKSITELEYRKARETDKECLIFLLDAKRSWPPNAMDMVTGDGDNGVRIRTFREELQKNELVDFFKTAEELANLVSQAVANWQSRHGDKELSHLQDHDRLTYLGQVRARYDSVKLPVDPADGLSLHAIFQPLTLGKDPLAAEDIEHRKRQGWQGEERWLHGDSGPRVMMLREETRQTPVMAENGNDAIEKSPHGRIVILGGPGTGKTTTLKYLAADRAEKALADSEAPLPVYLSLSDLARSGKTLQRYLVELVEDLGAEGSYAEVLWQQLKAGHAFLCLDGLDEVAPQQRSHMIDQINAWVAHAGNTWVIGSRFTEYKGGQFKSRQFTEWELQPMSHELRLQLAERLLPELQRLLLFAQQTPLSAVSFVEQVEQHPQAAAWGENPLLFSLAAVVFLKTGDLSASRSRLYHEVIEAILLTREPDKLYGDLLWRMLSALALWLHQHKGRSFTIQDLFTFLFEVQMMPKGEETVSMARRILQSGILEPVARNTYHFRHQTFQEYLAATELAFRLTNPNPTTREEAWELAWSKRTYSRWTEVLCLMVGALVQSADSLGQTEAWRWMRHLLELRETEEGDQGSLGLQLALVSVGELTELVEEQHVQATTLAKRTLSIWVEELLVAARTSLEAKTARLLALADNVGRLPDLLRQDVIEALVRNLEDRDEFVRMIAALALTMQKAQIPLQSLLAWLENEDWYLRLLAVWALATQGDYAPLEPLLARLKDENAHVRQVAVAVVGELGERVPLDLLLARLEDEDWNVRGTVAQVLVKQGERVPLEVLLARLEDENWRVRQAAVWVVGELGERVPLGLLLARLEDKDAYVRQAAIWGLGELGERVPLDLLLARLEDEDAYVRQAAVKVLAKQGERVPLEVLLALLEDEDASMRQVVVEALGQHGERVPLEVLLARLEDENWSVRQAAAEALGQQGERLPLERLKGIFQIGDENIRWAGVQVLGTQQQFVPLVIKALQDKNAYVRRAAVEALGQQKERVSLEPLLARLEDEDWFVRQAAKEAIKQRGERLPLEALLALLRSESLEALLTALEAIKLQEEQIPLEALLTLLRSETLYITNGASLQ